MSPPRPRVRDHREQPVNTSALRGRRLALSLIGVLAVVTGLTCPAILVGYALNFDVLFTSIFFMILLSYVLFIALIATPVRWDHWVRRSLTHLRCPGCRYELGGINPAPDGCTVCPECGAAWRLPVDAPQPPS